MNQYEIDYKQGYDNANDEWLERIDKIRAELIEEKDCAYADFERYKVEYLGQDWEDAYDSLPQDDFRFGMERCIEILDKYKVESEKQFAEWLPQYEGKWAAESEDTSSSGKPNNCEDCISRQTVEEMIKAEMPERGMWEIEGDKEKETVCEVCVDLIQKLSELPSVTPKQKMGRWEWVQYDYNPKLGNWHCSECRSIVNKKDKDGTPLYKYCPQCGAKMVEPQESEE